MHMYYAKNCGSRLNNLLLYNIILNKFGALTQILKYILRLLGWRYNKHSTSDMMNAISFFFFM